MKGIVAIWDKNSLNRHLHFAQWRGAHTENPWYLKKQYVWHFQRFAPSNAILIKFWKISYTWEKSNFPNPYYTYTEWSIPSPPFLDLPVRPLVWVVSCSCVQIDVGSRWLMFSEEEILGSAECIRKGTPENIRRGVRSSSGQYRRLRSATDADQCRSGGSARSVPSECCNRNQLIILLAYGRDWN